MKKLSLEDLGVESFETGEADGRGTVACHDSGAQFPAFGGTGGAVQAHDLRP
jgi:hypothetical protein